ncbi:hypothetical protein [Neolewinella antarctica]|uniref:Uncharacterized protein n=1 Tax=Neolewinella antarctica TaxID=442734 RepID=A0ABX0XCR0_9BACT|nr:hypothetical protein [Neolewinella antarctica]NJC27071.1 hypothetical protein [Neolewinella antarctica]
MNIAFGALVLLIALLPGIVFRFSYLKSNSIRKSINSGLLSEAIFILIPALLVHLVCTPLAESWSGRPFEFDQFFYLIVPPGKDGLLDLQLIENSLSPFFLYILLATCFAFGVAKAVRYVVVYYDLDSRFKFLRIYNEWDRYFTGHALSQKDRKKVDFVYVDVVVTIGGSRMLYKGTLDSYTLNDAHSIDQLTLSQVYRRRLDDDGFELDRATGESPSPATSKRYYQMPGNYFIIPFASVQNFNITYIMLEEIAEEEALPETVPAVGTDAGAG